MIKLKIFLIFLMVIISISCKKENSLINKENLLSLYSLDMDSLKYESVSFILNNMEDQKSEIPTFKYSFIGNDQYFQFDNFESSSSLLKYIREQDLIPSCKTIPDSFLIDNEFIIKNIELAFKTWNAYPWAKNVPKDIFFNYILPYKVYGESPSKWRSFFHDKYQDTISSILQEISSKEYLKSTNEIYYRILVEDVGKWFKYKSHPLSLTKHIGFDELMAIKEGDCYGWSYLNAMILRSIGIPATVDFIPRWGSRNGKHSTEVFWDSEKSSFRTASGREIQFPSKVFRYRFKRQNIWSDSIKRIVKDQEFLLEYLKHEHWIDVTHEHTHTVNVDYVLENNFNSNFVYICVFDYGKWEPVYWGEIDKQRTAHFNNMGSNILYRVAAPSNDKYKIISNIFKLDSLGYQIVFKPDTINKISLNLSKLNTGTQSWVKKDNSYSLYYLNKNSEWKLVNTFMCSTDSIIHFENVPSKTLYHLLETNGENRLERMFEYKDNKQVFY